MRKTCTVKVIFVGKWQRVKGESRPCPRKTAIFNYPTFIISHQQNAKGGTF